MKVNFFIKCSLFAIFAVVLIVAAFWFVNNGSKGNLKKTASPSDISDAKGLMLTKNYSECVDKLTNSIFDNPSDTAQAETVLGQCKYAIKDYVSALDHFKKAESLYSEGKQLSSLQNYIANTYRDMGDRSQAANYYKRALNSNPANKQASINYSYALLAEGEKAEAQSVINEAITLSPNSEELIKIKLTLDNGA